jgi:hypothetical protein
LFSAVLCRGAVLGILVFISGGPVSILCLLWVVVFVAVDLRCKPWEGQQSLPVGWDLPKTTHSC